MKKYLLLLISISIISYSKAIEPDWNVSKIAPELLVNANSVVRNYEAFIEIYSDGAFEMTVKKAVTILNEKGKYHGYFVEGFDKYSTITNYEGTLFDKNGKKVRRIKNDEFQNISAISGGTIFDDNRLIVANPKTETYPYTIVYEYKKRYKSFFAFPSWYLYSSLYVSVQKTSLKIKVENGCNIKFKGNENFYTNPNIKSDIQIIKKGKTIRDEKDASFKTIEVNDTLFTWSAENLPAIDYEPLSGSMTENIPVLNFAPEKFKMDDYEGSNNRWESLGLWIYQLGKEKNNIPELSKEKIKELASKGKNDLEKAKILYEYLQTKVRYVSIQLGIGGYQPFPAETVDKLSYGDCKALTNYMKTLLDIAGVKSYYCLVRAGDDSPNIDKSYVCSQFNHAFLMLPIEKDTLYLECTSQLVPFGYNGSFTDDRDILVIDSTKSYIKHTNVYGKDRNRIVNSFSFQVGTKMDCDVNQESTYIGVASEDIRYLMYKRPEDQKNNVLKRFQLRQVKISDLNYKEQKEITPIIIEKISYFVPQLAQLTSTNKAILPFNQVTQIPDLERIKNRKSNIVLRREQSQTDTIKYVFPKNFKIEKLPVPTHFSSVFGNYKLEVISTNNVVTFVRTIEWNKGNFKPELYNDLMMHQRKINEMDRQVIILNL